MWNENSSSSPTAASGDATARRSSTSPSAKSADAPALDRLAAAREGARAHPVRTRRPAIGASCSGSSVQLVSSDGSSTAQMAQASPTSPMTVTRQDSGLTPAEPGRRLGPWRRAHVRAPGSRSRPPTRSSSGSARRRLHRRRRASARSPDSSARRASDCSPRPPTGSGRSSSSRARAAACAGAAPTSPRTASTTCSPPAPSRCSCSTTSPPTASTPTRWRSSSRARPRCAATAGCALIGGETAELPGIYRDDELDFAGTCVGLVDRDRLVDGSRSRPATSSSGSRRRGSTPTGSRSSARSSATRSSTATTCSRRPACTSRRCVQLRERRTFARSRTSPAAASLGNLSRVLPGRARRRHRPGSWARPPVFAWLAEHVAEDELRRVFNLGIGYCAVVRRTPRRPRLGRRRDRAGVIGVLVSGEGSNLQALLDAGLPVAAVASNVAQAHGARARAERRGAQRRLRPRATIRTATRATRAMADWLERTASSSSSVPATCTCSRPAFLARFPDSVVNVHPALLPAFPGAHPIEDALAAGVTETAATVHSSTRASTPGAVHRAGARARPAGRHRRDAARSASRTVEHRLLPEVVGAR